MTTICAAPLAPIRVTARQRKDGQVLEARPLPCGEARRHATRQRNSILATDGAREGCATPGTIAEVGLPCAAPRPAACRTRPIHFPLLHARPVPADNGALWLAAS